MVCKGEITVIFCEDITEVDENDFWEQEERKRRIKKLKKKIAKNEKKLEDLELQVLEDIQPDDEDEDCGYEHVYSMFYSNSRVEPCLENPEPVEEAYIDRGARRVTRLTETILENEKLITVNGNIFQYVSCQGRYKPLLDGEFNALVENCLSKSDRDQLTVKCINEIKEKIKRMPELQRESDELDANPNCINCLNGFVEIDAFNPYEPPEISLLPHSSDVFFSYCVQAKYVKLDENEMRDEAGAFESFCATSFAGDVSVKKRLLLEQMGYAFSDSLKGKCMNLGIGAPNSGKSVIAKFIEKLLEPDNLCAIAPHELANDFAKARLFGKKINLLAEVSSRKLKGIDVIKSITSGDTITAAYKGKDSFEFRAKCKLWFFANNFPLPADLDPTDGFFNRLNVLFFPHSIPKEKQDLKLLEKLLDEKDLIFSMAVDAFAELVQNGYQFTFPEDSEVFLQSYKVQMNSVGTFIDDCLIISGEQRVHTCEILELYHYYCQKNGLEELSARDLHMQIQTIPGVKSTRFVKNGENLRGYQGIGIVGKVLKDDDIEGI